MDSDVVAIPGSAGLHRVARRGFAVRATEPSPVRLRGRRRPWSSWIVTAVAALMLCDGAASLLLRPAPPPAPIVPPPVADPAAWVDIPSPLHLFGLSGSLYARLPLTYDAKRRAIGDERQDTLTFGRFDDPSPYLRLAVHRTGDLADPPADLLVDLARLGATDALAVTRMGLPLNLMTRFGLFDTADVTVERGATALPCLGFRLGAPSAGPVGMIGIACGSDSKPLDRGALGCVLDRIDLVSAGDDGALRAFFVAAERRRTGDCASPRRRAAEAP